MPQYFQWFPGHMASAFRMMEDNLKLVDGVIVILDARAPKGSLNPKLDKLFANKKVLYVLNKIDLVDKSDVNRLTAEFVAMGKEVVAISSLNKRAVDTLYDRIFALLKEKLDRNKLKGVFKPIRIMVAGIPNTGKSSIINALSGGKRTQTGNIAGVTRGKQWVKLKELELLDTPGTMPPAFENQTDARHLAYIGSMNDANIDFSDLAFYLLDELKVKYPQLLKEKYSLDNLDVETIELFDGICKRRGFILKGNEYDYERCATAIIDDFRKGRIGKICLE